jgi:adenine-specific DNA-methyltransferase
MAAPRRGNAKTAANRTKAVQAIRHEDTRVNNPTADAIDLVTDAVEAAMTWRGKRDFAKDPQLVWKGKDEQDREDLEVPAPPIFRQELIEPRYLVKQLMDEMKKQRENGEGNAAEEDLSLFGTDFYSEGIADELDKVDWYKHPMNWTNRMILGDSLQVMASLAERENLRGKVQMIYFDPPYGIKFNSNWQVSVDSREVRDNDIASISREVEQIHAFRDTWDLGIHSYLTYLRDRISSARELLTESGSIFVQIGDENVHLVRSILDEVFDPTNFVSLIPFTKAAAGLESTRRIPSRVDYLVWYARDAKRVKYHSLYEERGDALEAGFDHIQFPDGNYRRVTIEERSGKTALPEGRLFRPISLTKPGPGSKYEIEFNGQIYTSGKRWWGTPKESLERLIAVGRVLPFGNTLRYLSFADDFPYKPIGNLWAGFVGASNPTYVVQTNESIVQRCMLMATDPGDLVLDPTCGSGTTAFVSEQWGRRWVTADTSRVAISLARHRLMGATFPAYLLADSPEGKKKNSELYGTPLDRSPSKGDVRKGFVTLQVPRIQPSAIANCSEIHKGLSREKTNQAILRNAKVETIWDKPHENKKAVRVAGPFTVESLSPHRSVSFDQEVPASEKAAEMMPSGASYEETILEHVKKAGVQNGYRNERLKFESVEPVSGRILTAVGIRKDAEEGTPARVGIALGPEYGTVDSLFIKNAAREALRFGKIDLLLILGFAFDANATEATNEINEERGEFSVIQERHVGTLTVLNVRMNPDLAMGDELANTGAGNLFTVFGEPDIEVTETSDGQLVAEIKGLDIYNPTTGDVRAEGPDDIMMWSIDTDYDAEAFIVRHVYFSGENGKSTGLNPYERLGKALKGQIDEEALATLFTTKSRPFLKPESGRIAVKVVNYYGDEVLKAIEV